MRKLLSVLLVMSMIASTGYSFVPLSNSENNLGSFRLGATRGMFYDELDILSASPVSLMEFEGNSLYTNWGNARYFNNPSTVDGTTGLAYDPALTYNTAGRNQFFNFGLTGNPLSYLGIKHSRSGVFFQNWGTKATPTYNLDNNVNTGNNPTVTGEDSEGKWDSTTLTDYDADLVVDRTRESKSDLKFFDNRTFTQWNAGIAYEGLILRDLIAGFSIANQSDSNIRKTAGTKTYADLYVNDTGAIGMPAGSRIGDSYTATFADKEFDRNSNNTTDILFQGRYPLFGMTVDGGIGVRMQNSYNPGNLDAAEAVSIDGREDVNIGGTQYYHSGSVITNRANLNFNNFVAGFGLLGGITTRTGLFTTAGGGLQSAITSLSDNRTGFGPIIRLEALKEWRKVNLTGIFNLNSVKQDVALSETEREYVDTKLYTGATTIDNYVATDFTRTTKSTGDRQITNLDFGGKIEFKALEGLKLAFGGFVRVDGDKTTTTGPVNSVELVSFDNGVAGNTPYTITTEASKPGPGGAPFGEGTWKQTISNETDNINDISTTRFSIPVGTEIKLSKKWTFGAGTQYTMTKTTTKITSTITKGTRVTESTPAGAATATIYRTIITNPSETVSTYYTEGHSVQYTYGVRFDVNKDLTIAANAFLDTNAGGAFTDLNTYRNLALQAVFHF